MKTLIQKTIEKLKSRVKENLEKINQNQSRISEFLKEPFSPERTYKIDQLYNANKELLNENNDFINLQLSLIKFMEKHNNSEALIDDNDLIDFDPVALLDDSELFELTIQGKLKFDISHPRFDDHDFFNRLLKYYTALEAYEKCNNLIRLKKSDQVK